MTRILLSLPVALALVSVVLDGQTYFSATTDSYTQPAMQLGVEGNFTDGRFDTLGFYLWDGEQEKTVLAAYKDEAGQVVLTWGPHCGLSVDGVYCRAKNGFVLNGRQVRDGDQVFGLVMMSSVPINDALSILRRVAVTQITGGYRATWDSGCTVTQTAVTCAVNQ